MLAAVHPRYEDLEQDQELNARHRSWCRKREAFNNALERKDEEAVNQGWQRDYMLGLDLRGNSFDQHQTRLNIREFEQE